MNNKVNYTLIGFLVLLGITLMFGFSYWMLKPSDDTETTTYAIYFNESVFGLNVEAPVKYRGLNVGKVSHLRINPKNTEQVEVHINILKSTPIKENTVARLTAQGITGLTYINLSEGKNKAPKLRAKAGEEYPVIKTVPSFFENFEQSLGTISGKFSRTLGKTEKLLDDKNQKNVAIILNNTAKISVKLDRLLDDKTILSLQKSVKNIESISNKMNTVLPNVNKLVDKSIAWQDEIANSFNSIMTSYLGIHSAMDEIKRAVESGEFNIKEISAEVIPTMNSTFIQMQEMMIRTESLVNQYKRSPADILYKEEKIKKAPGE